MTLITDHEVRMENAADKRAWWNIRLLAVRSVMTDEMAAYQSRASAADAAQKPTRPEIYYSVSTNSDRRRRQTADTVIVLGDWHFSFARIYSASTRFPFSSR